MIRDKINKLTFFKKYLFSYLFILIIPLVLSSYAYNQALQIVKDDAIESRLYMLKHLRESVDKYFNNVDESIVMSGLDYKLTRLMNYSQPVEGSSDMYWFYDYASSQKFSSLKSTSFDSTYYIYLKNNETVFSNNRTSFGFEDYYESYLNFTDMSYAQWYDIFFNEFYYKKTLPATKVNINGNEKSIIPYLYTIPLNQNLRPNGVIAIFIDESSINKLLSDINIDNLGFSYITDESGTVITGSKDSIEPLKYKKESESSDGYFFKNINGQDMIVAYTKSSYNGWTYTAVLPFDAVMGNVKYIRQISVVVAIVSLLLGILVSLLLSYNNSKIFKDIKKALKDFFDNDTGKAKNEEKNSDYDIIYGGISNLIIDNKEMQKSLQKQVHALKSIFIDRLLKGEFDDRKNMDTLASHVGIKLVGNYFTVAIIRINPQGNIISPQILEELDVIRVLLEDILKKTIGEYYLIRVLNENELAIIMSLSGNSMEESHTTAVETISAVRAEFLCHYHIAPLCGIGSIYSDIMEIHYSFNEAKQALYHYDRKNPEKEMVIWYDNISKEVSLYYYPGELEQKLINYTKSGSWDELEATLNKIHDENFNKNPISDSMCKLLFYDMQATYMKLVDEIQYKPESLNQNYELLSKEKPDVFFKRIKESYCKICMYIIKNKKSHNTTLKENILDFINKNFTDGNLSVCLVASYFNLSESYFSQFFKEQTGETFSSYLENLRIGFACKLIKEQSLSIDQIAQKTGYNNTNSFRRAFKKVTGIVPSAYR